MGVQDWIALLIACAAATWLVVRWRRRGLDDDEHAAAGCSSCPANAPRPEPDPTKEPIVEPMAEPLSGLPKVRRP